jgi:hypothetical protein
MMSRAAEATDLDAGRHEGAAGPRRTISIYASGEEASMKARRCTFASIGKDVRARWCAYADPALARVVMGPMGAALVVRPCSVASGGRILFGVVFLEARVRFGKR